MTDVHVWDAPSIGRADGMSVETKCYRRVVLWEDYSALRERYESAVRTLQDIAAMSKKAGSESAAHRLAQLGEPREP